MNGRALDIFELLRTLARHEVDYVVVGGVAVQVHGHRRTTRDLDVIARPTRDNLERLAAALAELEAQPRDIPGAGAPTAEQLATAPITPPLATEHGELHVLRDVPGVAPYDELRARAQVVQVEGLELVVAARDDIVAMKRASGRKLDLDDIAVLTHTDGQPG